MERASNARAFPFAVCPGSLLRLARSGVARLLGLSLIFALAAIVQTWPLVLHLNDHIQDSYYYTADTYQAVWNLWWTKYALVDLHTNPLHTDLLFFPDGTDLYLHTLGTVNGILSIPLQVATGNVFLSWNVLSIIFFVLSALGAYALSYRVSRSGMAALLSAYIFAFAPFVVMQLNGRWHIAATWPIPLLALFLLRFQQNGLLRDAAVAGIFWAVLTYNNLEYAIDAALFLGLFAAYWLFVYMRRGDRGQLLKLGKGFALVAAVWFTVSAPLLIPALQCIISGKYPAPGFDEYYSADALAFVTPSPLWGPGKEPVFGGFFSTPIQEIGILDSTMYLGILPLILAAVALLTARRTPHRVLPWAAVFVFFFILSLGPYLYVGGSKTVSILGLSFSIPLPYQILDNLPLVGARRIPARLIVFGILGLSVLAGTGFAFLTSLVSDRYRMIVPLLTIVCLTLIVVEYWNPPVHLSQLSAPTIFKEIRDEPGEFSVLDVPWGRFSGSGVRGDFFGAQYANYYQVFHNRPTMGGYIARTKEIQLRWVTDSGLGYLALPGYPGSPTPADLDSARIRRLFQDYRIKYVAIHLRTPHGALTNLPAEQTRAIDSYLRNVVRMTQVYSDDGVIIYRNPGME